MSPPGAIRVAALTAPAVFAVALVTTKAGWVPIPPAVLGALGGGVAVVSALALAVGVVRLAREKAGRVARGSECALFTGLLITASTGVLHLALDFHGMTLLDEGVSVRLERGKGLDEFAAGPLAPGSLLSGWLGLADVELKPSDGGFVPVSTLEFVDAKAARHRIRVSSDGGASVGPVVFQQGAFGFAARLVLHKDRATVFDQLVHFTSRLDAHRGVAFVADVEVPSHGVTLVAQIDVSGLGEDMKGHPVLRAEVRRGDELIGAGTLLPGHDASMADGWGLGFGALKMWSEVDVRRGWPRFPTLGGLLLAVGGAIAWPFARWRRW